MLHCGIARTRSQAVESHLEFGLDLTKGSARSPARTFWWGARRSLHQQETRRRNSWVGGRDVVSPACGHDGEVLSEGLHLIELTRSGNTGRFAISAPPLQHAYPVASQPGRATS